MNYPFEKLAYAHKAYIEAPAGCGKTFAIAQAVALAPTGQHLILTHTHAGVASLRTKLRHLRVPSKSYHVDTIAGWCQRLIESYPNTIGYTRPSQGFSWVTVYRKAADLLSYHFIRRVIRASYSRLYVDEYQDCTQTQHTVILCLAELVPCCVLGDPLQAIFGFDKHDPLVKWETHVAQTFERLPPLEIPWRWRGANSELGETLLALREPLLKNQPIDLGAAPISWSELADDKGRAECLRALSLKGSIVAICGTEDQCHSLAKQTGGRYKSIETIECKALREAAVEFERKLGLERVQAVTAFIERCATGAGKYVKQPLSTRIRPASKDAELRISIQSLQREIRDNKSVYPILELLSAARTIPNLHIARLDLWEEMTRSLSLHRSGRYQTLEEAAIASRNQTRDLGRSADYRTAARTLLVKGLEFDHTILIIDGQMTKENIYVALTRGARSLTIVSASRLLVPKKVAESTGSDCQLGFAF